MNRIDAYIFRQLLVATAFVTVTLTCVVWLSQSLRFIEMIVNRGLSVPLFVYFTLLLLPTFLAVIIPIALFASVLFVYNRMLTDSELIVMRAGGCSQLRLARPAIVLGLLMTATCYLLTTWLIPTSYRNFKDLQYSLRNSFPTVLLQEGVFNSVAKGVTVFVRERDAGGELSGIIIHDSRNPKQPVTMMAGHGAIVSGTNGPRVVMASGNRQEVNEKDGRLSLLYFDRYSFDIGTVASSGVPRWRDARERYLDELFWPPAMDDWIANKMRMEGHHRLATPLLPLAFALVGLALLLGGDLNRRGQLFRILCAIAVIILIEVGQLGIKNQWESSINYAWLLYLIPVIPAGVSVALMAGWRPLRRRIPIGAALDAG